MAIENNGIPKSDLKSEDKEFENALNNIWRNGWLHAEESNYGVRYVFASEIHHW